MNEEKPTQLLQRIFDLRKAKKISLIQLGKALGGVNGSTASQIENGEIPLKAEYIPAIAKLLEVEPAQLFVDYEAKQVGLLSEEEARLVLAYRKLKDSKDA